MNWDQPICDDCWIEKQIEAGYPGRSPVRLNAETARRERCCYCNRWTYSGIYIRIHPDVVPFPSTEGS